MGPCPPGDTHGDFFILYTLDERLNLPAGETRDRLVHRPWRDISSAKAGSGADTDDNRN